MRLPHGKIIALRESPSGKASAFQADIRGFESRLPLWEWFKGYRLIASGAFLFRAFDLQLSILGFQGPWRSG